jgi:prepilin-type N-terminal cleavage/methylation domain-containing protein
MARKLAGYRAEARCEKGGVQHGGRRAFWILKPSGFALIEFLVVLAIIAVWTARQFLLYDVGYHRPVSGF